ncbi:hypothetical protein RVR_9588 [Actinacidiphila reveromycinica]|uniref:Adhesin domain-containing protein n=1 Tax=Actinacidiphila reveromycinica TaxID=659352 RepID=A0A7U3V0C7_9ACTN|nr:hypothetical protein [Streptomyces sp. SN-593]BBB01942.1 hypothetical protein RVR_9588 [Streptomyces sp. SN-593]
MGTVRNATVRRSRAVAVGVAAAVVAVVVGLVAGGHAGGHGTGLPTPPATSASGAGTRFTAAAPRTLVLDGVSGKVRVTASGAAHAVSGTFRRDDGAPARARWSAGDGGALVLGCRDGSGAAVPCAGDLALTMPSSVGLRLRQTSGDTVLAGIGGPLTVAASSVRLTATGLRPGSADVQVTSGSVDLAFAAAPADLAVRAVSAYAALRLPARPSGSYSVATTAASADVRVQVPHTTAGASPDGAPPRHRVTLDVVSGSVAVLPL